MIQMIFSAWRLSQEILIFAKTCLLKYYYGFNNPQQIQAEVAS